ncbi:MAG: tol-pal system protein YbgF [candidate division WOR-3 bacterium]|nr:tol-pal system protein YbgF [candidate division WOR-3 bacterium]
MRINIKLGIYLTTLILSIYLFTCVNCAPIWRFVRQGTKMDSLEISVQRIDSLSRNQNRLLTEMKADVLTNLENLSEQINQLSAKIEDNETRLSRVYQKLGIGRTEEAKPESIVTYTTPHIEPDELYNSAYLDFTKGNFDVAIEGFKRYLKYFPNTELSDNAQYWIGECYYSKKQYPDAILEFEKVVSNYPEGNKVPSAIYKIGLAYQSMNEINKAKRYYKKVIDEYPNTNEAKLAKERFLSLP